MPIVKRNGRYQARLESLDGRIMSKTFDARWEAEEELAKWKREKRCGEMANNEVARMTLGNFFEVWKKDHLVSSGGVFLTSWKRTQNQLYRDFIEPHLAHNRLRQLKPVHLQRVLHQMEACEKSEQMRLHVFNLMHKMFSDAIETYQILTSNPATRRIKPVVPRREARHLNLQQCKDLLSYADGKKYGLAVWIQLYMGLRAGEVQGLRWEDIDLETGWMTIRRSYNRREETFKEYPKGKKQHSHAIPGELWTRLSAAYLVRKSDLVLCSQFGNVLPYRWYLKALKGYLKSIKAPMLGTHGLRHSTSELYMSHGASKDDLRNLFAHSSISTTERYLHGKSTNLEKICKVIRLFPDGIDPKSTQTANCQISSSAN